MHLIAGLGNPGPEYAATRHNVGFRVVDELARRHDTTFSTGPTKAVVARIRPAGRPVMLAKPLTYMNLSGQAVAELVRYFRLEVAELLVVTDDVNLPLARLRARPGGSSGGHNGLASVETSLGTAAFARLRVGVGRGDARRDLADHVLAGFEAAEAPAVDAMVDRAADAVETFIIDGLERMMNRYNQEDDQTSRPDDA